MCSEQIGAAVRVIKIPNVWRERAQGLIIRSVPVALYSDDTSGNVSKKWNKHMSFYLTLGGLSPKLTNQEYYIEPMCTSNTASALELAGLLVEELKSVWLTFQMFLGLIFLEFFICVFGWFGQ